MARKPALIAGIDKTRLKAVAKREAEAFAAARPKTKSALDAGTSAYLDSVPMHWMKDWPMPFPMLVAKAEGARLTDIDGHEVDDFCLGDTGSMFGHSPAPVAKASRKQARTGLTYMLPTEAALEAGPFGIRQPASDSEIVRPSLVLAPLLAFDPRGNRLGYGKGYFDRAIASLRESGRVFYLGLAYAQQQADVVPAERHDIPLDWVETPVHSVPLFLGRAMAR